ncbi:hypothetical protein WR25_15587 [Diploscapter pachys]|uniref:Metallo-beta-lactamase domain-containing protein n=1 Tax=Diploscapter pachys TaxID=2018661 RepID=A0A2A2LB20_9BILA|nr:hypothetical protein WR25_15587 [Diploscapter pachys]
MTQISSNVYYIVEKDTLGCNPLCYLIFGSENKVLLVDTGCGCGNLYFYLKNQAILKDKRFIVVNTHNHPEQIGGNWRFSTTGRFGLAHAVDDLCASRRHKYYTRLLESNWHWTIETYKITRWLKDGEMILLGPDTDSRNVVQVLWTPGHTPDSLVLWYPHDKRLFIGDLFYRFDDIMFTSAKNNR